MKVYVVLKELDDPWYGPGNIQKIFDTKTKAENWIDGGYKQDSECWYNNLGISSELTVEEWDVL